MKKSFAMLLVVVLCLCIFASACGDTKNTSSTSPNPGTSTGDNNSYKPNIPQEILDKYKGETFTFYQMVTSESYESDLTYNDYEDGQTKTMSDAVNDAIKERNARTEEAFGITIEEIHLAGGSRFADAPIVNEVAMSISSGDTDYDVLVPSIYAAGALAVNGSLYDLSSDVPYLDLSKPYWDNSFNESVTIDNKVFFTVGDIGVSNKNATMALGFNKTLFEELDIEIPYQSVKDGTWTLDKAISIAKSYSSDLNNDGKITHLDAVGWSGQEDDLLALFYGCGQRIAQLGEDGYPELTMYNSISTGVVEAIQEFVLDRDHYLTANDYWNESSTPVELTRKTFTEGNALFFSAGVDMTASFTDMSDSWGLLPNPKYSESQPNYYSNINPWTSTCFCITRGVSESRVEFVGAVLEYMAAESREVLLPAYYDTTLKNQRIEDQESVEMLDIIFSGRGCDLGVVYRWGKLDEMLKSLSSPANDGLFTSKYESLESAAQLNLDETVEAFKKNIY